MEIKSSMFVLDVGVLRGQTRVLIYYRGETKSQSWRDFVSEATEQRLASQSSLHRALKSHSWSVLDRGAAKGMDLDAWVLSLRSVHYLSVH